MSPDSQQERIEEALTEDVAAADRRRNRLVRRILFGCAAITVLTTIAIFLALFDNAVSFFYGTTVHEFLLGTGNPEQRVGVIEFLTDTEWHPSHAIDPRYGLAPLIAGTLLITVLASLLSIPVGTATAIYLAEYASPRVRSYLKPTLEILAGVPTVVYGYFAISFITPVLLNAILGPFGIQVGRLNALSASIAVGIMTIPMVASISEDAMQAVPDDLKHGAYAMGASKHQVILGIVLPAAISGILAAYILAISRAIGETMIVALAAGHNPNLTADPLAEVQTMTAFMVHQVRGTSAVGSVEYQSLFAVGLALFLITLGANLLNDVIKRRYREEYR